MQMKNLSILGTGQYGMVAREIADSMGIFNRISFLDDKHPEALGKLEQYADFVNQYDSAAVALGNSEMRLEYIKKLEKAGFEIPVLIHRNAYVSPSSVIDNGCFIEPMAVVHTTVKIGIGCIISAGTIINHDAVIGDGCHIDCGVIVKARENIADKAKITCGQVIG